MSRIDDIKAFALRKENERKNKEMETEKIRLSLIEKVKELYPRIKELIETANACLSNGIEIDSYWNDKINFCTDSCSHRVGFVMNYQKKKVYYMGINGGGCCGKYNFRVSDIDVFEEHEDNKLVIEPTINHLEKFLDRFDEFESRFYEYVDGTVRG